MVLYQAAGTKGFHHSSISLWSNHSVPQCWKSVGLSTHIKEDKIDTSQQDGEHPDLY